MSGKLWYSRADAQQSFDLAWFFEDGDAKPCPCFCVCVCFFLRMVVVYFYYPVYYPVFRARLPRVGGVLSSCCVSSWCGFPCSGAGCYPIKSYSGVLSQLYVVVCVDVLLYYRGMLTLDGVVSIHRARVFMLCFIGAMRSSYMVQPRQGHRPR